jgi:hypothetical protein
MKSRTHLVGDARSLLGLCSLTGSTAAAAILTVKPYDVLGSVNNDTGANFQELLQCWRKRIIT